MKIWEKLQALSKNFNDAHSRKRKSNWRFMKPWKSTINWFEMVSQPWSKLMWNFMYCIFLSNGQRSTVMSLFLWCPFSLLKLLIGFRLNPSLVVAWKYFMEALLFLFYVRKDQLQKQSGCNLWFRCNKQKNYLHC